MAYYTTGITITADIPYGGGRYIRVTTTHTTKTIQCYISGLLIAEKEPVGGVVEFDLGGVGELDIVFLLAVDNANAGTNYWPAAFPTASSYANRIKVRTPQHGFAYMPGDQWVVYLGDAGDAEATTEVYRQNFFPGGRLCCGYGFGYGGAYGFDADNGKGYGYNYGYGEYGIDCEMLEWISDPLPRGTYPVKVVVEDQWGNESTAYETTQELDTFARPATSLAVSSYDKDTDQLVLTFTGSLDITA